MYDSRGEQLSTRLLAQLAERGTPRTYRRGEIVFEEGEHSDSLYILLSGELKVFTRGENARELVYNAILPGEFFGELVLDGGPRSASVKAVVESICIVVARDRFRDFMASHPEFGECLVLQLIARVRHVTGQLRDVALKDVYGRVSALLSCLARDEGGARVIDRSVTQQEIANRVGSSREMVNQILRELIRGGYLAKDAERRLVLLKDLPRQW